MIKVETKTSTYYFNIVDNDEVRFYVLNHYNGLHLRSVFERYITEDGSEYFIYNHKGNVLILQEINDIITIDSYKELSI